ncbi:hypothetical protein ACW180_01130 [Limosilactobacillus fermentum]
MIDPNTHQILGATIYAEEAFETINVISVAMQNNLPPKHYEIKYIRTQQ